MMSVMLTNERLNGGWNIGVFNLKTMGAYGRVNKSGRLKFRVVGVPLIGTIKLR